MIGQYKKRAKIIVSSKIIGFWLSSKLEISSLFFHTNRKWRIHVNFTQSA